ncbi:MAG: HNH endonuclease [Dehalococcoidales bacterium]|nr:HNH endonuclease [Dehalococcoidales bacterium]
MAKGKRKVKEGFWVVIAFIAIIVFALISSWWKENAVLGWVIVACIIIGFSFSMYRFPSFRAKVLGTAKSTSKNIIFEEEEAIAREPMPQKLRQQILNRADNRCENPECKARVRPHVHHIDGNNSHNVPRNLIALCPNCHTAAHHGQFSNSQLRNWVNTSWERYKAKTRTRR